VLWLAVEGNGRMNQVFQRRRIDAVAFVYVYGAARFGFKAGVEETMRVIQRGALEKVDLDVILEGSNRHNVSVLRPYGRVPFPFFCSARSGITN
jgi:hypothetical protein